jgi:DNA-binding CsgD family transcriptional regulator
VSSVIGIDVLDPPRLWCVSARLTPRERELLSVLLLGGSLAEAASTLSLSERTVKFHQKNLLEKLGADSRADLVRILTF